MAENPTPATTDQQIEDWLEDGALHLPPVRSREFPGGKSYTVPSPDITTGIRLAALGRIMAAVTQAKKRGEDPKEVTEADVRKLNMNDAEERDFQEQVLTAEVIEEMRADGVAFTALQALTKYAFFHFAISPEAARDAADKGLLSGKAPAPANRAERRAKKKKTR